ncbi:hypothetical protein BT69DRAFT_1277123 [Atractiella rhizophila]|nr:hypothetical protein BT69DRAFT_1277123 [Atractiella rhizophila]
MIEDYSFLYFATILQDEVCERIENICLFRPPGSLSPDIVTRKFGKAKRVWSCGQWGLEDGEWWDRDEDEKVLYKQFHPESNEEAECCGHGQGRRALGEGDPNILAKNAGTKAEKKIVMLNDFFHI